MKSIGTVTLIIVSVILSCSADRTDHNHHHHPHHHQDDISDQDISFNDDDYYDLKERILETSYHGMIKENETIVEITPMIKVDDSRVCDFHIIKKSGHDIPFQIELVNNLGVLKAKKALNCEKRRNYKFDIAAIFCDGSRSKLANVHITVIDINEYSPIFLQPSYVTEVDEGQLYKEIIRVEATDRDCTPLYGDVCKYEIIQAGSQPFTIDNEGVIRNTEPLSHKLSHNHILSVVAYDCAMKESAPVMVNIKVRRLCEERMIGIPERIDYMANSMENVPLFPKLHLELCDMQCKEDLTIQSTVSLQTKHISFGCDRDSTRCNQSNDRIEDIVDLLPKDTEWTKDLVYDEGTESVFHFDGTTGAIVPSSVIAHHDFSMHPFSIMTMFRHRSGLSNDKHIKEHIICSADDHKMNRHHMALFVRNCRLIMLLRKNFNEGDLNIFSPAEWRWKIEQVCDNEWHHYAINVDLPKVELYIDGQRFETDIEDRRSNPEVIDDWPLHAAHGINTTLMVGACYQGSENRLKHGFSGDISEIRVSRHRTLSVERIRCGTECVEHLIVPAERYLGGEQQIRSNSQLNEIEIDGSNATNIEQLLQRIQYGNGKRQPTIGRRNIEIRTTVSCGIHKSIRLPTAETYVMVTEPIETGNKNPGVHKLQEKPVGDDQMPQIVINGSPNHLVSYPDIKQGVRILANISVQVLTGGRQRFALQKLDSCSVTVFPSLNPDHEEITLSGDDERLSATLDIKTNINKDGVEMIGYDSTDNYMEVLKSLIYTNKKPAYYLNRVFKMSCAQMNSRFRSAEFTLTLTVLHPKQLPSTVTPIPMQQHTEPLSPVEHLKNIQPLQQTGDAAVAAQLHDGNSFAHATIHLHDVQEPGSKLHNILQKGHSASHSTLLIVVICVAFVVLICGVGIARLRNNSTKVVEKHEQCPKISTDQQLDWDDSALTITINPMQNGGCAGMSDDSSDSDNSDSEDEELATSGRYRNVNQLEWDNSTM